MLGRHKNLVGFVVDQTTHISRHGGFLTRHGESLALQYPICPYIMGHYIELIKSKWSNVVKCRLRQLEWPPTPAVRLFAPRAPDG